MVALLLASRDFDTLGDRGRQTEITLSNRTKLLVMVYLASGFIALAMMAVIVGLAGLSALGYSFSLRLYVWPFVAATMSNILAKLAAGWSARRDIGHDSAKNGS